MRKYYPCTPVKSCNYGVYAPSMSHTVLSMFIESQIEKDECLWFYVGVSFLCFFSAFPFSPLQNGKECASQLDLAIISNVQQKEKLLISLMLLKQSFPTWMQGLSDPLNRIFSRSLIVSPFAGGQFEDCRAVYTCIQQNC